MFSVSPERSIPVHSLDSEGLEAWKSSADERTRRWVEASGFRAKPGELLLVPDEHSSIGEVLAGREPSDRLWALAHLPSNLPEGDYHLQTDWPAEEQERAAIGWALGCYRFDRYKEMERPGARLVLEPGSEQRVRTLAESSAFVRDLVNTPAIDLGPGELADTARTLASEHGADCEVIEGERLEKEFPAIHVVGQAASRAPRLIRMQWGREDAPSLALVGKGVIFDSGGLNIKPGAGMLLMKKDMGGAAHVLGLAKIIMTLGLDVNLRVYIPAVENAISGNAYRPSDIINTRKGTSVAIGNTDAEGRVVLSDALTLASEEGAERIIDFATLTGAARIALGEDLPPIYGRDTEKARTIQDLSFELEDPLWHMPLFEPYREQIEPAIADISNTGTSSFGGSLTAALFLDHFVDAGIDWYHLDIYAWNLSDRPGRPAGGEAQGLRSMWQWLASLYE
ncbi:MULTISPECIES: M17 family metallopeptidase [unclassified Wenzhouxiangella]|uniref:leucyl aminopeptidase family protein n=1 Tax=unclassified Wenzhouxiangella TaxID=2613841 RepID=UPI000E32CA2B|nr:MULTISPECIES: leucyl aminopeptidase family protein [unclassified Wenzhouxiangella]RFF28420.1 leucyl aminopeptidase family protein [Wenzhouxiangella sp. 15181]RFP69937.1 leucyl aminopeptidase family protein [Wenzhouxiangella sp. 15190]